MIYAMSDIHGQYELFEKRIEQLRPLLEDNDSKLILLGDFIDRGNRSFDEDVWLEEDKDFLTSGTFLTKEQFKELDVLPNREVRIEYVKKCIKEDHKELLVWMKKLRLFYETDTQIFVHAGVDEDIPEEEAEWCTIGTPDYVMTGKFPPSVGHFYKDIIAGHVAASHLARDLSFSGIFFDGESHYYIDGSAAKFRRVLCLAYDEKEKKYYQFDEDGKLKEIKGYRYGS